MKEDETAKKLWEMEARLKRPAFQLILLDCFPSDLDPFSVELKRLEQRGLRIKRQSATVNAIEWALPALLTLVVDKALEGVFSEIGKDLYAYFKKTVKALSKRHDVYYASPSQARVRAPTFRIDARVVRANQEFSIHFCHYKNASASEALLQKMLESAQDILENSAKLGEFLDEVIEEATNSPYNTREPMHQRTWFYVYYDKRRNRWRYLDDDRYAFERGFSKDSQKELLPLMKKMNKEAGHIAPRNISGPKKTP